MFLRGAIRRLAASPIRKGADVPAHRAALATVAALAATGVIGAPAFAGRPVSQSLTPPPPDYYTCTATGSGALCRASLSEVFGPEETGLVCGSGDAAFTVFDSGSSSTELARYYDRDGNLTRRVVRDSIEAVSTNPLTGASVPYRQHETHTTVLAVPGDFNSATTTDTGVLIYTLPHEGHLALEAGRVVGGADGIEFRAGPQTFVDYYGNGDTAAVQKLCNALGA
jgi:hypothetical protein